MSKSTQVIHLLHLTTCTNTGAVAQHVSAATTLQSGFGYIVDVHQLINVLHTACSYLHKTKEVRNVYVAFL